MPANTNSEKVIRRLYEITNNYDAGFDTQINQLLQMGLDRFQLDIAILSHIEDNRYMISHCVVPPDFELTSGVKFDLLQTYCHITCQADAPVAIAHMGKDDRYAHHPAYQAFGLESYIGMPIRLHGQLYGTLNFSSANPYQRRFNAFDIDVLQLMASWVQVELIRRGQEQRLQQLNLELQKKAYEDSLTAIPNRRAMFKHIKSELNRIQREQGDATLAIIDIDFFKRINDSYGHIIGDKVLAKIAESMQINKRNYDFLARLGGEEFLLWLPSTNVEMATIVCQRVKDAIENLALLPDPITVSIGLVYYNAQRDSYNDNWHDMVDQLLSEADSAMYQAKQAGRNCVRLY